MEFEDRIFVDKVEQLLRPQYETENDLARLHILPPPIDHPGLDERNYVIRYQLGVDTQVLAVHQVGQNGVRNGSDPTL